jgi:hypothetical protein
MEDASVPNHVNLDLVLALWNAARDGNCWRTD